MLSSSKSRLVAVVASMGVVGGGLAVVAFAGIGRAASAPPGDNGDVKVHQSGFSTDDERNQPHVICSFYLDGFNFDPDQSVTWVIKPWSPGGDHTTVVLQGTLDMGPTGHNWTTDQTLPAGHYKLFWNFTGEHGKAKQKVFWVSPCSPTSPPPTSPPPTTSSPPTSSPPPPPTSSPPPPPTSSPPASPTTPAPAPSPTPVQSSLPVTG